MKSSFDQQLKQQLEQSRPEDLGYKPDRDKLWSRIEAKQKRKRLPLRMWLSHAAAIAAGLVIGYFLLSIYKQDAGQPAIRQMEQSTAALPPQPERQAGEEQARTNKPALAPTATAALPKIRNHNATAPVAKDKPQPLPEKIPEQPAFVPVPEDQPETAPVLAARPKEKVLHLMDMKNENTRLMQAKAPQPQTGWARLLPDNDENGGVETFSAQISKHILHKNK